MLFSISHFTFQFRKHCKRTVFFVLIENQFIFIKNDWLEDDSKFLFVFHLAKMGVRLSSTAKTKSLSMRGRFKNLVNFNFDEKK
jgi:hypothetical protein